MPLLLIIGGPNGAGKTTFAREYLTREMKGLRFLNTDEIARGLSPFDVDSVALKAGRIFLQEMKSEIEARRRRPDTLSESISSGSLRRNFPENGSPSGRSRAGMMSRRMRLNGGFQGFSRIWRTFIFL